MKFTNTGQYKFLFKHLFSFKMVKEAIKLYGEDKNLPQTSNVDFFNEKQSIHSGTTAYLARVCIENLLKFTNYSGALSFYTTTPPDVNCKIS